ncbi:MAG: PilT protein domain-containing protein, partial [bacterium]
HRPSGRLEQLLRGKEVLIHPFVLGEISCGQMQRRKMTLFVISQLGRAPVAPDEDVLEMVETRQLFGIGLGFIDAHLLMSARIANCALMTRDRALIRAAHRLGVAMAA